MNLNGQSAKYKAIYDAMLQSATAGKPFVSGRSMGPKPRFFIVGDEPSMKDLAVGMPFTGPMNELFVKLVETLEGRYEDVTPESCYATYLVKCIYVPGQLTEDMVTKEWVPLCQLEYHLSGCEYVIPLGKLAKYFVGHIQATPTIFKPYVPNILDKAKTIWRIIKR